MKGARVGTKFFHQQGKKCEICELHVYSNCLDTYKLLSVSVKILVKREGTFFSVVLNARIQL